MKSLAWLFLFAAAGVAPLLAQPPYPPPPPPYGRPPYGPPPPQSRPPSNNGWTYGFEGWIGMGATAPVNPIAQRLNTGFNIAGGAGVTNEYVGVLVDLMYNDLPINRDPQSFVLLNHGTTRIWALTFDPIFHVNRHGPVDFYVTGGAGLYHRTVEFRQPVQTSVIINDPVLGVITPVNVQANEVIASYGVYKGGVDGGAGFAFRIGSSNLKVFAEARYHHMFTSGTGTDIVPVTIGVRW